MSICKIPFHRDIIRFAFLDFDELAEHVANYYEVRLAIYNDKRPTIEEHRLSNIRLMHKDNEENTRYVRLPPKSVDYQMHAPAVVISNRYEYLHQDMGDFSQMRTVAALTVPSRRIRSMTYQSRFKHRYGCINGSPIRVVGHCENLNVKKHKLGTAITHWNRTDALHKIFQAHYELFGKQHHQIVAMTDQELRDFYMILLINRKRVYHGCYHSLMCNCKLRHHMRSYCLDEMLPLRVVNGGRSVYSEITHETYPMSMSIYELIRSHAAEYQSEQPLTPPSWIPATLVATLSERVRQLLSESWHGIAITVGAVTSIVMTVVSIIASIIEIIRNGCNALKITSLAASFIALLAQIAVAVGIVDLFNQVPDLMPIISSIFGELDPRRPLSTVLDESTIETPDFVTQNLYNPINNATTNDPNAWRVNHNAEVRVVIPELPPDIGKQFSFQKTAGDGSCGYAAIMQALGLNVDIRDFREFLLQNCKKQINLDTLSVPMGNNGCLDSPG